MHTRMYICVVDVVTVGRNDEERSGFLSSWDD